MSPAPMIWFQAAGATAAVPTRRALVAASAAGVRRSRFATAGVNVSIASNEADSMKSRTLVNWTPLKTITDRPWPGLMSVQGAAGACPRQPPNATPLTIGSQMLLTLRLSVKISLLVALQTMGLFA